MQWSKELHLSKRDDEWDFITYLCPLTSPPFVTCSWHSAAAWQKLAPAAAARPSSCPALLSCRSASGGEACVRGLRRSQKAGDESDEHLSGDVIFSECWRPGPAVWVHWDTLCSTCLKPFLLTQQQNRLVTNRASQVPDDEANRGQTEQTAHHQQTMIQVVNVLCHSENISLLAQIVDLYL